MYLWIKAFHIISVIVWMAGLFYLPRLYVYHCEVPYRSAQAETFKVMEWRLLRFIMNPGLIATWFFGLWLLFLQDAWAEPWMHVKLTAVVCLTVFHMLLSHWRRQFAENRNRHGARFYRIANEAPTVFMILIVILVVVQPEVFF